jgi:hypothetical protein
MNALNALNIHLFSSIVFCTLVMIGLVASTKRPEWGEYVIAVFCCIQIVTAFVIKFG